MEESPDTCSSDELSVCNESNNSKTVTGEADLQTDAERTDSFVDESSEDVYASDGTTSSSSAYLYVPKSPNLDDFNAVIYNHDDNLKLASNFRKELIEKINPRIDKENPQLKLALFGDLRSSKPYDGIEHMFLRTKRIIIPWTKECAEDDQFQCRFKAIMAHQDGLKKQRFVDIRVVKFFHSDKDRELIVLNDATPINHTSDDSFYESMAFWISGAGADTKRYGNAKYRKHPKRQSTKKKVPFPTVKSADSRSRDCVEAMANMLDAHVVVDASSDANYSAQQHPSPTTSQTTPSAIPGNISRVETHQENGAALLSSFQNRLLPSAPPSQIPSRSETGISNSTSCHVSSALSRSKWESMISIAVTDDPLSADDLVTDSGSCTSSDENRGAGKLPYDRGSFTTESPITWPWSQHLSSSSSHFYCEPLSPIELPLAPFTASSTSSQELPYREKSLTASLKVPITNGGNHCGLPTKAAGLETDVKPKIPTRQAHEEDQIAKKGETEMGERNSGVRASGHSDRCIKDFDTTKKHIFHVEKTFFDFESNFNISKMYSPCDNCDNSSDNMNFKHS